MTAECQSGDAGSYGAHETAAAAVFRVGMIGHGVTWLLAVMLWFRQRFTTSIPVPACKMKTPRMCGASRTAERAKKLSCEPCRPACSWRSRASWRAGGHRLPRSDARWTDGDAPSVPGCRPGCRARSEERRVGEERGCRG